MVASIGRPSLLATQLKSQHVDSNLSMVRSVSCPVDPMRRYRSQAPFRPEEPEVALRLQSIQNLFEWAYGFRAPSHACQRFTRRSPSAGALYPTELFLVTKTDQSWRVLYYDFSSHQFYNAPVSDAEQVAFALGLDDRRQAVLFNSILWRTVQRYGVRGYRYCLLDGAHVAANLVRGGRAWGARIAINPGVMTTRLEDMMRLGHGEALTAALICDLPADQRPVGAPLIATPAPDVARRMVECPPILSPLLSRAMAFHRETLYSHRQYCEEAAIETEDSLADLHFWGKERYSAKDFGGDGVSREQYDRMIRCLERRPPVRFSPSASLIPYTIRLSVDGLRPAAESARPGATSPETLSVADARRYLWRSSQKQNIVQSSAFLIVLAARKAELAAGGCIAYRHTILNAGAVCAELYREAANCCLGTTSIGGFSDDAISEFLGDTGLHPIVMQAFGVPLSDAEKRDAVVIAKGGRGGTTARS
jgi:hypothetical protein